MTPSSRGRFGIHLSADRPFIERGRYIPSKQRVWNELLLTGLAGVFGMYAAVPWFAALFALLTGATLMEWLHYEEIYDS